MSGTVIRDTWRVAFDKYSVTSDFETPFLGINSVTPALPEMTDGFIGIQPDTANEDIKKYNFIFQLKDRGYIDHFTIAFYIS